MSRRARILRWIKRIVLGLLVLVVVGVGVVLGLMHTDWGRDQIRARVEAALVDTFPGATIGRLEGSVFTDLIARDVRLPAHGTTPAFSIDTLRIDVALQPLVGNRVRVERLIAQGVAIDIDLTAEPIAEPPAPASSGGGGGGGWVIELPDVSLRDVTLTVSDEAARYRLERGHVAGAIEIDEGIIRGDLAATGVMPELGLDIALRGALRIDDHIAIPAAFASIRRGRERLDATATNVVLELERLAISGRVAVHVDSVELPHPVTVAATAVARGGETSIDAIARSSTSTLTAAVIADIEASSIRGVVGADRVELDAWSRGELRGVGTAAIAVVASPERVRGSVIATAGGASTITAFDAAPTTQWTAQGFVLAAAPGATLSALGRASSQGGDVVARVEDAHVGATVDNARALVASVRRLSAAAAQAELPSIRGKARVSVLGSGPLDALVTRGRIAATGLRVDDIAIARLAAPFSATVDTTRVGDEPIRAVVGNAPKIELRGVVNAGTSIGSLDASATTRGGPHVDVRVTARPAAAEVVVDAAARVTPTPGLIDIAIERHSVRGRKDPALAARAGNRKPVDLRGRGGRVTITDTAIGIEGIRSTGASGTALSVDARLWRATGDVEAKVELRGVPAALVDRKYRGEATGALAVSQRGGRWTVDGTFAGRGLAFEAATPFDADAKVNVRGRRVTVEASAAHPTLGGARFVLQADGPADITDVERWKRVKRDALRQVTIGLARVDAARLTDGRTGGVLDGTVEIRDGVPSGEIRVTGVPTPVGGADGKLTLALNTVGFVDVGAAATVGALGGADATIRLAIPERVFDPAAWQRLGARVVDSATITAPAIAFDPALLGRLGVTSKLSGVGRVTANVGAGASSVDLVVDVEKLRGGALVKPLAIHLEAGIDDVRTRGALRVMGSQRVLVDLPDLTAAVGLDRWIDAPRAALATPVRGKVSIPRIAVAEVLAYVGRGDVTKGAAWGAIDISGTVGAPTIVATLDATGVKIRPALANTPPPVVNAIHVDAAWGPTGGRLAITATEASKGKLAIAITGDPREPKGITGRVDIDDFDLAPVVAFLPGALVGARGKLDVNLGIKGVDSDLRGVRGRIALHDGRIPFSTKFSTLRRLELALDVTDAGVKGKLDGRIGGGSISAKIDSGLDLATVTFGGEVTKVSPIAFIQPVIDAKLSGRVRRDGNRWIGDARLFDGNIFVPLDLKNELLDEVAPGDLYFVDLPPKRKRGPRTAERPWLIVDITVARTQLTVPDLVPVDAVAAGDVRLLVGRGVGLEGEISVIRGSAEISGHRYRVNRGIVRFDGSTDGRIDLELAHDFKEATFYVRYASRISAVLDTEPELAADPALYTQGQLFGFLLGGEPGQDASQTAGASGASAAFALLSSTKAGRKVTDTVRRLTGFTPRCTGESGLTGPTCGLGRWITKRIFLIGNRRIDARPDENATDVRVEWYVSPRTVVEANGGDRLFFGLDVLRRWRW